MVGVQGIAPGVRVQGFSGSGLRVELNLRCLTPTGYCIHHVLQDPVVATELRFLNLRWVGASHPCASA